MPQLCMQYVERYGGQLKTIYLNLAGWWNIHPRLNGDAQVIAFVSTLIGLSFRLLFCTLLLLHRQISRIDVGEISTKFELMWAQTHDISNKLLAGGRHDMPPPLQVDNIFVFIHQVAPIPARWPFKTSATSWPLTLKLVSESRVTWATSVPILVFLGLSVLELGPMYATDRHQTKASLNASAVWGCEA